MAHRRPRARPAPPPQLVYQAALIGKSLDVLGRRWTLIILRDVGFLRMDRFGQILRNNPGLTPRVLSRRLREMAADGLLKKTTRGSDVRYVPTAKAEDALFILFAYLRYGLRHFAAMGTVAPAASQGAGRYPG